jgi:hypothetical protein
MILRISILLLLLTGCSANWHLKQACKKEPSICAPQVLKWDTIYVTDTLEYYEEFYTDVYDTVVIDTGSVIVKIIRENNILRTYIKQKGDTVRVTKTITLPPRIIPSDKEYPWWLVIVAGILFILLILKK